MSEPSIDWEDQRTFLAVLETGSLSGAARLLGLAQPTVRRRIEALEAGLGVPLFTRSLTGLTPTLQARDLAIHVRTMAASSQAFVRAASAPEGEIAGTVRITVSEFVGIAVLPAMLLPLRQRYPGLVVEIALSDASADLLGQEADIAVRMHRPRQGALVAQHVGAILLKFFAHGEYIAQHGMPESLEALADHALIGPDRTRADLALVDSVGTGMSRRSFAIRTDSHAAQFACIRAGLGIGVLQMPIGLSDPGLVAVLPGIVVHSLETWLVAHEDIRKSPRVAVVFDHLAKSFTDYARGRVVR
jgi:DNA-binding transcriptional LysR family regulator